MDQLNGSAKTSMKSRKEPSELSLQFHWLAFGLKHRLQTSSLFWFLLPMWRDFRFRLCRLVFPFHWHVREIKNTATNVALIIKSGLAPGVFATCATIVLLGLNHSFFNWLSSLPRLLSAAKLATGGNYVYIPSTGAQISATLLAVYIAAVAVVASTGYAGVSAALRRVLLRDSINNAFVKINVFVFAVSMLMLFGLFLTGFTPGLAITVCLIILLIVSVASIANIASRGFLLFDPTELAGTINSDILQWAKLATTQGWFWYDPAFQSHYQKQAALELETQKDLVIVCLTKKIPTASSTLVCEQLVRLYVGYGLVKSVIPSESLWFRPLRTHTSWMTANQSYTNMALTTGTALRPSESRNLMWLENEILSMLKKLLKTEQEDKSVLIVNTTALAFSVIAGLASAFMTKEALELHKILHENTLEFAHGQRDESEIASVAPQELNTLLGTVEVTSMLLSQIILSTTESIEFLGSHSLQEQFKNFAWSKRDAVCPSIMPRSVSDEVARLQRQIICEIESEGGKLTPEWYLVQIVAASLVTFVCNLVEMLINTLPYSYLIPVDKLISDNHNFSACQLIEKGLESCSKLALLVETCDRFSEKLCGEFKSTDAKYSRLNADGALIKLKQIRRDMIVYFSLATIAIRSIPHSAEHWPDYVGHAYWLLCEQCHEAVVAGDAEESEHLFSQLIAYCLESAAWLEHHPPGIPESARANLIMDCFVDLLQLSGYAKLYSELDGPGCWETIVTCWNEYLARYQDPTRVFAVFRNVLQYAEMETMATARGQQRFKWGLAFKDKLRQLGLIDELLHLRSYRRNSRNDTTSSIVRAFLNSHFIKEHPEEVFFVTYVLERTEAAEIRAQYHSRFAEEYWGSIDQPKEDKEIMDDSSDNTVDEE